MPRIKKGDTAQAQAAIGVEPVSPQRVTLRSLAPLPSFCAIIGLLTAADELLP